MYQSVTDSREILATQTQRPSDMSLTHLFLETALTEPSRYHLHYRQVSFGTFWTFVMILGFIDPSVSCRESERQSLIFSLTPLVPCSVLEASQPQQSFLCQIGLQGWMIKNSM